MREVEEHFQVAPPRSDASGSLAIDVLLTGLLSSRTISQDAGWNQASAAKTCTRHY